MKSRNFHRRGNTLLEFAMAATFILIPLTLGATTAGMMLTRSIHIFELSRDAGHMFARGVDFSQATNQAMLVFVGQGLNITQNGGDGVLILSAIQCTGNGTAVCTRRFVIGNAGLCSSSFANPTQIDASGNVNYQNDAAANASSFLNTMPMSVGQTAYVVETYFTQSDYDWTGFLTGNGTRLVSVF